MPMVSLKLMAGAARSMVVASARTTAAEIRKMGFRHYLRMIRYSLRAI
jgi:hypothetical protein